MFVSVMLLSCLIATATVSVMYCGVYNILLLFQLESFVVIDVSL